MGVGESRSEWSMLMSSWPSVDQERNLIRYERHTHLPSCQKVNPIATSAQVRLNNLRAHYFIRIGAVEEAIHANRFAELHVCL
jgi:hypothetical protein